MVGILRVSSWLPFWYMLPIGYLRWLKNDASDFVCKHVRKSGLSARDDQQWGASSDPRRMSLVFNVLCNAVSRL